MLGGGPEEQITHFTTQIIRNFRYSPDGKWIVMDRGPFTSDAVLFLATKQRLLPSDSRSCQALSATCAAVIVVSVLGKPRYTPTVCALGFPANNCLSTYCKIPPLA